MYKRPIHEKIISKALKINNGGLFTLLGLFVVLWLVTATIYQGWIGSIIWNWWMPSLFNLPFLNVPQFVGIVCIASILRTSSSQKGRTFDKPADVALMFAEPFLHATFILAVAYAAKHWPLF